MSAFSSPTHFVETQTYYESSSSNTKKGLVNASDSWTTLGLEQPVVIAMVGLPARGKSYLVKMLIRYLRWSGFETEVFNVGSYRREIGLVSADSSFFDNSNKSAQKVREEMAMMVQETMYTWLHETTTALDSVTGESHFDKRRVAIFDATNTTINRRQALADKAKEQNVFLLFVESICNDQAVLNRNYDMKLQNEDYRGMDPQTAKEDFLCRVHAYEKVYETIVDTEDNGGISYIKLENVGEKMITRNCSGYLPSQVAFYLQNVHIQPRKIYLTLVAECLGGGAQTPGNPSRTPRVKSTPQQTSSIGRRPENIRMTTVQTFTSRLPQQTKSSDSHDSVRSCESNGGYNSDIPRDVSTDFLDNGEETSLHEFNHLLEFLENEREALSDVRGPGREIALLLGNTQMHMDIASTFKQQAQAFACFHTPILNELRGGLLHGLSVQEIQDQYPEEFHKRVENKLEYRYPGVGGESYLDVIERVRPIIIELERQRQNMFLVCHLAVLRCIYAYFMGVDLVDIPFIDFKMNNIYELTPGPHGCQCTIVQHKEEEVGDTAVRLRCSRNSSMNNLSTQVDSNTSSNKVDCKTLSSSDSSPKVKPNVLGSSP